MKMISWLDRATGTMINRVKSVPSKECMACVEKSEGKQDRVVLIGTGQREPQKRNLSGYYY